MYKIGAFIVSLSVLLGVASVAWTDDDMAGIIVSGTAEVSAAPDTAFITFGVQTEAVSASQAARDNSTRANTIVQAIIGAGVSRSNIRTAQYSIEPIITYRENQPPVTTGYRVTNQVRVKVTDIAKLGALIDTAVQAGANNVQSISFTVENDTQLRQQVIVQAIENARAKADTMAKALGVKIDGVIYATESANISVPRPIELAAARGSAAQPTPILPGEMQVSATVTINYSIVR